MTRIGTIAYATSQGLGYLAKDFYDHGVVTDVFVALHDRRENLQKDWYPKAPAIAVRALAFSKELKDFIRKMDVMLFFETPFFWDLLEVCHKSNTIVTLMPMHECMPVHAPYQLVDYWLCPSELDVEQARRLAYPMQFEQVGTHRFHLRSEDGKEIIHTPVPVNTKQFPWRERTIATTFVHNAGHGGLKGRNGTREVLEAWKYVSSKARLLVRSQETLHYPLPGTCEVVVGDLPRQELYTRGDVFLFPERFNGLSLPLQEACASGMAIIAQDRFPINRWLSAQGLVKPLRFEEGRVSGRCVDYQDAIPDPMAIAARVDRLYGEDITGLSYEGSCWACKNSWAARQAPWKEMMARIARKEALCG